MDEFMLQHTGFLVKPPKHLGGRYLSTMLCSLVDRLPDIADAYAVRFIKSFEPVKRTHSRMRAMSPRQKAYLHHLYQQYGQ